VGVGDLGAPGERPSAHVVVDDLGAPRLEEDDAHHLGAVLRLRAGEAVTATDGRGGLLVCRYVAGGALSPSGSPVYERRPEPAITLAFAPVKGERPEWAVQKLTEIGVDRIVLLRTERGVVKWEGTRAEAHLGRLRKVAREAVMQSRRRWLPEVCGPEPFSALAGPVSLGAGSLPSLGRGAGAGSGSLGAGLALAQPGGAPPSLDYPTVLIGPEGGWSDSELAACAVHVGLGPAVMRTETAAVAAGVLLVALRSGVVGAV
jgi:16S rRNA (uracil1498-N3)-methyltransferase